MLIYLIHFTLRCVDFVLFCSVLSCPNVLICLVFSSHTNYTPHPIAPSNLVHNSPEVVVGFFMRGGADQQLALRLLLFALNMVPEEALYLKGFVYTYYLFVCLPVGRIPRHIDVVRSQNIIITI